MRIALAIEKYDSLGGGAERWTDQHARYLLANGFEVHAFARTFREPPPRLVCHTVDIPRISLGGRRLAFAAATESAIKGAGSFDCVHDMGSGWFADIFMPHHGTRRSTFESNTILWPAGLRSVSSLLYRTLPRYREFESLERRQFESKPGKVFLAVSKMVAEHFEKLFAVPSSQIAVVYNGVDVENFKPTREEERDALRNNLGWNDKLVFLFVAHNFRLKGLDALLKAFARFAKDRPECRLAVVGKDRPAPFARQAAKLRIANQVEFLGSRESTTNLYRSADVLVHPTVYDPCSLVVLEALASGLPVISSVYNGASEVMTAGVEGEILSNPRDDREIESKMLLFLNPARREVARIAARAKSLHFTRRHNSDAIIELYRRFSKYRVAG